MFVRFLLKEQCLSTHFPSNVPVVTSNMMSCVWANGRTTASGFSDSVVGCSWWIQVVAESSVLSVLRRPRKSNSTVPCAADRPPLA